MKLERIAIGGEYIILISGNYLIDSRLRRLLLRGRIRRVRDRLREGKGNSGGQ